VPSRFKRALHKTQYQQRYYVLGRKFEPGASKLQDIFGKTIPWTRKDIFSKSVSSITFYMYYIMYTFVNNGEYNCMCSLTTRTQVNLFAQALEWIYYFTKFGSSKPHSILLCSEQLSAKINMLHYAATLVPDTTTKFSTRCIEEMRGQPSA